MAMWLLQNAVGAGVLALLVYSMCRVFRLGPAARHALWLLVLLKLLAPPFLAWPWALPSLPDEVPQAAPAREAVELQSLRETGPVPAPEASGVPAEPAALPARNAAGYATPQNARALIQALWITGSLLAVASLGRRLLRLLRQSRRADAAPEWLAHELARASETLRVRPPRLAVLPNLDAPCLLGVLRPRLLVPAELLERLDLDAWRGILVHELAHLRRRDHWVGLLELLAACLWWWNPVFWYTRRRLREDAELACDAWVVALAPGARRTYAEALVSVLESLSPRPAPVGVVGMGAIGRRLYERRLTMILRDAPRHRLTRTAFAAVATLAIVVLPGWAQATDPAPVQKTALDQAVTLDFENVHLAEFAAFLAEQCDLGVAVDWAVVAPPPPLQAPLPRQLFVLDVQTAPDGTPAARITLGGNATMHWYKPGEKFEEFELLRIDPATRLVTIKNEKDGSTINIDPDESRRAFDNLQPAPGVPTALAANAAYATDGTVRRLHVDKMPLKDVLKAALKPMGLDYLVAGPLVWISTPERLRDVSPDDPARADAASEKLAKALDTPVAIAFQDQHVSRIADYFVESLGINIVADPRVIAPPAPKPVAAPPGVPAPRFPSPIAPASDAYATDGIVRSVQLIEQVPLRSALFTILRPLDLDYVALGDVIFVSTPDRLADANPQKPAGLDAFPELASILDKPCSIEFESRNLSEITGFIQTYFGVETRFDPDAAGPDGQPIGDIPVRYVRLEGIPLWEALYWLLTPLDLTYAVKDNALWIQK